MPEAIPGLFVGCLLSNLLNPAGFMLLDVVAGSLTTLLAAYLTFRIGCKRGLTVKDPAYYVSLLPPVLLNAVIVGCVVHYLYVDSPTLATLPLTMLFVGIGEVISVYFLGSVFYALAARLPGRILTD